MSNAVARPPRVIEQDEFDLLEDEYDFSLVVEDWEPVQPRAAASTTQIVALPPAQPAPTLDSPPSSFDDEFTYDDDFLAQVNALESAAFTAAAAAPAVPRPPATNTTTLGSSISGVTTNTNNAPGGQQPSVPQPLSQTTNLPAPAQPLKRSIDAIESIPSKRKKSVRQAKPDVPLYLVEMLESYEQEISCPICCDIFVCPQSSSPCGHTFCAPCADEWIVKNKKTSCPACRGELNASKPLIPNLTAESFVGKHIEILGNLDIFGAGEWAAGGEKLMEWEERKILWKNLLAERGRSAATTPPSNFISAHTPTSAHTHTSTHTLTRVSLVNFLRDMEMNLERALDGDETSESSQSQDSG
ncbi:hypothetical protein C8J56DRAFT_920512 [Mycena floridula]|nr:hypothetical protein C8J56DRAFT_920512 [Mycena floridula]